MAAARAVDHRPRLFDVVTRTPRRLGREAAVGFEPRRVGPDSQRHPQQRVREAVQLLFCRI